MTKLSFVPAGAGFTGFTGFPRSSVYLRYYLFVSSQEERLRDRKTESEENLQKRLNAARVDMKFSKYLNIVFRREKWQLHRLFMCTHLNIIVSLL